MSNENKRLWFFVLIPTMLLTVGVTVYLTVARAEIIGLYPGSCLGGWINTQNAQGRPSLELGASADLFNETNSAVLKNTIAQIFCGSFNGNIPQDNEPKKVLLKFSWNIIDKTPIIAPASTTVTIIGENFASSTDDIVSEPSDQIEFILIVPETATGSEDIAKPEIAPAPETIIPSEPSSFWRILTDSALAQEMDIASSTLENIATSTPDVLNSGEFLEISYTLDGVHWTALGKINKNNWRDIQFALPLTNWADIQKVQIEIKTIPTIDELLTVYLDGMVLEVEYGSEDLIQEIINSTPSASSTKPLKVRNLQKNIVIDDEAIHSCRAEPLRLDISGKSRLTTTLILQNNGKLVPEEVEIGSLPIGIDITFSKNKEYLYQPLFGETVIDLEITSEEGSQKGSFGIPIIYTQKNASDSMTVCQINIVNF